MKKIEREDQAVNLARSIASDILIYHREAVLEGIREDDFYERLGNELDEGRKLYGDRVALELRTKSNHFERAIVDVLIRKATLQAQQV